MYRVVDVKPIYPYKLWIKFSDNTEGEVDLSDLVGKGVFAKLRDRDYFYSVRVNPETHTVEWPGGLDLCPDRLYSEISRNEISSLLKPEVHNI